MSLFHGLSPFPLTPSDTEGNVQGAQFALFIDRIKQLEQENKRLRRAVSDLTLETLILKEAASGNY